MSSWTRYTLCALAACLALPAAAGGQAQVYGTVRVSVLADSAPAERALVSTAATSTRTDAAGLAILRLPPEGRDKILPLLDQYAKLLS